MSAAIVTTLRDAGALGSFVAYHLAIGFVRLFLCFDDPGDPDIARFAHHPRISVIAHDTALRERWKVQPEYGEYAAHIDTEVMARQVLNTGVAMEMARAEGIDWLVHIDSDELFFLPAGRVADHFAQAGAVDTIRYLNLEAVPEKDTITDPFREVDLFKVPVTLAPELSQQSQALLEATPQLTPGRRFHFYSNGKSAVRLASNLRPKGVHGFAAADGQANGAQSQSGLILHYACCGLEPFAQKYARLGSFGDRWFGRDDIAAAIGPLHLEARDAVAAGRDAARDFYRRRIAIQDHGRAQALIREGVLVRFPQPARLLARL